MMDSSGFLVTMEVLILGCGFTGRRVAERLLRRGVRVTATTRNPAGLARLAAAGAKIYRLEVCEPDTLEGLRGVIGKGALVVHSIPVVEGPHGHIDPTPQLLAALGDRPSRIVYLSTTGVYGGARQVDETTPAAPRSESGRLRVQAEQAVARGPWSSLILRPAAIYGPGRGVQERMRAGSFQLINAGDNIVSRIHVDDLAAHVEAALFCDLTGAFPVADEEPCSSRQIAEFCAEFLGLPLPPRVSKTEVHESRLVDRRVDGSGVRKALRIELKYPSYRVGVPASLKR
jgi:nucleoside-diphosphate-sugar epimerase